MKKFFAKLILFSLLSIFLATNIAMAATAAEEEAAYKADKAAYDAILKQFNDSIKDSKDKPCINEKGDDQGYIITIIEEPLLIEQSETTTKNKNEFESRICYRNTFTFNDIDKKEHKDATLSTKCSDNGYDLSINEEYKTKYNVRFSCQQVQVLLSKGGSSLLTGYIGTIYRWAAGLVGIIAVTIIIISGIQISLAGGDTEALNSAKTRIIKSLSGIAILFLSGVILNAINPNFFV